MKKRVNINLMEVCELKFQTFTTDNIIYIRLCAPGIVQIQYKESIPIFLGSELQTPENDDCTLLLDGVVAAWLGDISWGEFARNYNNGSYGKPVPPELKEAAPPPTDPPIPFQ